ncbi:MAG: glycerol acyltransferase [Salinivirgaceae bacterium]|nr:MAG: glycerol acyltransferase [Salinivirgaceae bacterium]
MIIKANHKRFYKWFYGLYAKRAISKYFNGIEVFLPEINPDKSLLVLANHHSWWDGFWAMRLNELYWKKEFYVMMLKSQLLKHKTFIGAGAFSIDPGSRSIIESINYTVELLSNNKNMVLLFPQGKIQSQQKNSIHFEQGVNRIIDELKNTDVLLMNTFTDYFSNKKNTLFVYGKVLTDLNNVEGDFNQFYEESKLKQSQCML